MTNVKSMTLASAAAIFALTAVTTVPTVASAEARQTVSELRNEGYVEEEIRGVIRLTPRGYKEYKRKTMSTAKRWA